MSRYKLAIATAATLAAVVSATSAHAEPYDSKLQASIYKAKLVQAVDECSSPTTIIGGIDACAPANVTTDPAQFSVGSISVKSVLVSSQVLTILKSSGNGDMGNQHALGGKSVITRLVVRVTKRSGGTPSTAVTWEDFILDCVPPGPISGTGNLVFKTTLSACGLPSMMANPSTQKEIVSASVIDAGTQKPIAVPGVRKK